MGSQTRPDFKCKGAPRGSWDDIEEDEEKPIWFTLLADYFLVYHRRRRVFVHGKVPADLENKPTIDARTWRRHERLLKRPAAWERADQYRGIMEEKGLKSLRALALQTGEDHSRIAKVLKVLQLPEAVLAKLRQHSTDVRVRAHFTEKRLHLLMKRCREAEILGEIERVVHVRS